MARGDELASRVEVSWWDRPFFRNLDTFTQVLYLKCFWSKAVKLKRSRLPRSEVKPSTLALEMRSKPRYCSDKLKTLLRLFTDIDGSKPLLHKYPDGSISVCGVRSKHRRLDWKDNDLTDPYGDTKESLKVSRARVDETRRDEMSKPRKGSSQQKLFQDYRRLSQTTTPNHERVYRELHDMLLVVEPHVLEVLISRTVKGETIFQVRRRVEGEIKQSLEEAQASRRMFKGWSKDGQPIFALAGGGKDE